MSYDSEQVKLLKSKVALMEIELKLKTDLGMRYLHKFYKFQRDFINSTNRMNLLTCFNQAGKSSCQIIKALEWGFSSDEFRKKLWPSYKPESEPLVFFYLYPDQETLIGECQTKFVKYLPKGIYLENNELAKTWGWNWVKEGRKYKQLNLRNCIIEFKTYGQGALNLQARTCHAIFCDEEISYSLYPEITSRLNATEGYFHMVFTATKGEPEWYRAIEKRGTALEMFPNAFKQQISAWDCIEYEDGTPSQWTKERIISTCNKYGSQEEIDRRVHGRFIMSTEFLIYSGFSNDNMIQPFAIPDSWEYYCGIDIGMGGRNHKSSISIVAVRPDHKYCAVIDCWRGDDGPTTPEDVLDKLKEMLIGKRYKENIRIFYDHSSKDFKDICISDGTFYIHPAEKGQDYGIGLLNTLFKNKMLQVFDVGDGRKIQDECRQVRRDQQKHSRSDDLCFTAGNWVLTSEGKKDISKIEIGDMVWTRKGLKKVINTMNRKTNIITKKIYGKKFKGTPDHNFIIKNNNKIKMKLLTRCDTLYIFPLWRILKCIIKNKWKQLNSKELNLTGIQSLSKDRTGFIFHHILKTVKKVSGHYIKKFGKILMVVSQKDFIFITKMVIHLITTSVILNVYQKKNICENMALNHMKGIKKKFYSILKKLGKNHLNGINQKKGKIGTKNIIILYSLIHFFLNILAKIVGILTRLKRRILVKQINKKVQNSALENVKLHIQERINYILKKEYVLFVAKSLKQINIKNLKHVRTLVDLKKDIVYNITVEDEHEYYLNGILVANCDSVRFSVTRIPWDFSDIKSDELITKPDEDKLIKERSDRNWYGEFKEDDDVLSEINEWRSLYG